MCKVYMRVHKLRSRVCIAWFVTPSGQFHPNRLEPTDRFGKSWIQAMACFFSTHKQNGTFTKHSCLIGLFVWYLEPVGLIYRMWRSIATLPKIAIPVCPNGFSWKMNLGVVKRTTQVQRMISRALDPWVTEGNMIHSIPNTDCISPGEKLKKKCRLWSHNHFFFLNRV